MSSVTDASNCHYTVSGYGGKIIMGKVGGAIMQGAWWVQVTAGLE